MKLTFTTLLIISLISLNLYAASDNYRGQENREIKSLSTQDIDSIQTGKGWGMAKPAELNGYPGPRHVLDMVEELALSPDQLEKMSLLFKIMQTQAIAAGAGYLEAEQKLDKVFKNKSVTSSSLKELIYFSAQREADLRYIHLETHLKTIKLLSKHQIITYNQLRGYGENSNHNHLH